MIKLASLFSLAFLSFTLMGHANDSLPAADNTARNIQDRNGNTETPFDQSEQPKNIQITATIRREIIKDDSLSILAKNVKIITSHRQVVLRGPVASLREKSLIGKYARKASPYKVINQLKVKHLS